MSKLIQVTYISYVKEDSEVWLDKFKMHNLTKELDAVLIKYGFYIGIKDVYCRNTDLISEENSVNFICED